MISNKIYGLNEYYKELYRLQKLADPPINYKELVVANKRHFCEVCGTEIHKNEVYWHYKPNPIYHKAIKDVSGKIIKKGYMEYFKWRKRCVDCTPMRHSEIGLIEEE